MRRRFHPGHPPPQAAPRRCAPGLLRPPPHRPPPRPPKHHRSPTPRLPLRAAPRRTYLPTRVRPTASTVGANPRSAARTRARRAVPPGLCREACRWLALRGGCLRVPRAGGHPCLAEQRPASGAAGSRSFCTNGAKRQAGPTAPFARRSRNAGRHRTASFDRTAPIGERRPVPLTTRPRRCASPTAAFVRRAQNGRRSRPGPSACSRPFHRSPRAIALPAQGGPPP